MNLENVSTHSCTAEQPTRGDLCIAPQLEHAALPLTAKENNHEFLLPAASSTLQATLWHLFMDCQHMQRQLRLLRCIDSRALLSALISSQPWSVEKMSNSNGQLGQQMHDSLQPFADGLKVFKLILPPVYTSKSDPHPQSALSRSAPGHVHVCCSNPVACKQSGAAANRLHASRCKSWCMCSQTCTALLADSQLPRVSVCWPAGMIRDVHSEGQAPF